MAKTGTKSEKKVKSPKSSKRKLLSLCIASAVFAVLLAVLILLRLSPAVSAFLLKTLSRAIIFLFGNIVGILPISVYEIFLYLAGLFLLSYIIATLVFLFRKKWVNCLRALMSMVLAVLVFCNVYFAAAGFSYTQSGSGAPLYAGQVEEDELREVCDYFLEDFNAIARGLQRDANGSIVQPYSDRKLSDKLRQEYKRTDGFGLNKFTPHCKSILSSRIMSEMHICGVFFAPLGEPNINKMMPAYEKPFTMAHEMAHAKGIMREDDANAMATYVTITSDDDFIRYSGYQQFIGTLFYSWIQYGDYQTFNSYADGRDSLSKQETIDSIEFWSKFTLLARATEAFNDFYLKLMGQKKGTEAYTPETPTEEVPVKDPETGEQVVDPGTGKPQTRPVPVYNDIQRIYFEVYKNRQE